MISANLPFPVSTNALFFNRDDGGRAPTREYKVWQTEAGWALNQQHQKPIKGTVSVACIYEDGRKSDLDNLMKPILDLLVRHGLIDGDGPAIVRSITMAFSDQVEGVRVVVAPFAIKASS